jgi:hypothetical protein
VNLQVPYAKSSEKICDSYTPTKTSFVRISTVFGLCATNYSKIENRNYQRGYVLSATDVASMSACTIRR